MQRGFANKQKGTLRTRPSAAWALPSASSCTKLAADFDERRLSLHSWGSTLTSVICEILWGIVAMAMLRLLVLVVGADRVVQSLPTTPRHPRQFTIIEGGSLAAWLVQSSGFIGSYLVFFTCYDPLGWKKQCALNTLS